MSLFFRNGRPSDVPDFARLGAHSFPAVGMSHQEWEARLMDSPHGGAETLWVGEEGGRVVAGCRLYRFQQWIAGRSFPIMGLGTVAIASTHRRRGIAAQLVTAGLLESRARGDVATALYPFRTAFYRKLGYGMAGEVQQYRFPPTALPDHPARHRVSLALGEDSRAALRDIYDRWAPLQSGQLARAERAWEQVVDDDVRHAVVYRSEEGDAAGYAIFRYITDAARGGRSVDVEEIVWLTREARLGLYGWLASLADQWDFIIFRAHPAEQFGEYLSELRFPMDAVPRWHFWFPASTTLQGPMFRLLDLEAAWRLRPVKGAAPFTVALEVHDEQVAENAGTWTLRFEGGACSVERASVATADLEMKIGIEPLSRLFIGALTPSGAAEGGIAVVERPERLDELDRILEVPRPWTFDRF